jgi:fucose permease
LAISGGFYLVPTALYGFLFVNEAFPVTERVSSGISTQAMVKACTQPLFIIMVFCMLLTAATELGTNQWITALLSHVGIPSILLLVFINGLMAIGRSLAGEVVHKLSPMGMLLFSALFSAIGLSLLAHTSGGLSFVAAAIFAVGICFFWPTMLGFVSEYLPKTGALGLSIMGGAGMLSVSFILPFIGYLYEAKTRTQLPVGADLKAFQAAATGTQEFLLLKSAQLVAGAQTLQWVAVLPCVLIIVFE